MHAADPASRSSRNALAPRRPSTHAGLHERRDGDPSCPAIFAGGEQRILAAETDRADGALDGVGVEPDATILEEPHQAVAVVQRVADGLRGRAAAGQAGKLLREPGEQVLDQRPAARLANGAAKLWQLATDLRLDGIERGDAL